MDLKTEKIKGLGKRFNITLSNEEDIMIIDYYSGKKEIFLIKDNKIKSSLVLSEEEAKDIGFILAGLKEIEEEISPLVKDKVVMEWFEIKKNFKGSNKSIAELKIRHKTGASIVAIKRGEEIISSPKPEEELREGDKILIIGPYLSIEKAKMLIIG